MEDASSSLAKSCPEDEPDKSLDASLACKAEVGRVEKRPIATPARAVPPCDGALVARDDDEPPKKKAKIVLTRQDRYCLVFCVSMEDSALDRNPSLSCVTMLYTCRNDCAWLPDRDAIE